MVRLVDEVRVAFPATSNSKQNRCKLCSDAILQVGLRLSSLRECAGKECGRECNIGRHFVALCEAGSYLANEVSQNQDVRY